MTMYDYFSDNSVISPKQLKEYNILSVKVRLRWFGTDLVKLLYLCYLPRDLSVLYIKWKVMFSPLYSINIDAIRFISQKI